MRLLLVWLVACVPEGGRGGTGRADTAVGPGATGGPRSGLGAVCINEFMADNASSVADETNATPDWIELHNAGTADVTLGGWSVSDDASEPGKHRLVDELTVPAGGFLLLWADALPELGPAHLAFQLDDLGEEVALFAPNGEGTAVTFGATVADLSVARQPDCCVGDGCLQQVFLGTPGASNVP